MIVPVHQRVRSIIIRLSCWTGELSSKPGLAHSPCMIMESLRAFHLNFRPYLYNGGFVLFYLVVPFKNGFANLWRSSWETEKLSNRLLTTEPAPMLEAHPCEGLSSNDPVTSGHQQLLFRQCTQIEYNLLHLVNVVYRWCRGKKIVVADLISLINSLKQPNSLLQYVILTLMTFCLDMV